MKVLVIVAATLAVAFGASYRQGYNNHGHGYNKGETKAEGSYSIESKDAYGNKVEASGSYEVETKGHGYNNGYNSYNKGHGYNSYNKGYGYEKAGHKAEGSYSIESKDAYGNKVEASGSYEVETKGHGYNNGYNSYNKGHGYNSYNKGYGYEKAGHKAEGSYSIETKDAYGNKVEASGSYEVETKGHGYNNGYNSYNKGHGYNSYNKGYGYEKAGHKAEGSYSIETKDAYGNKVEASGSYEVETKGHGYNNGYNSYNKGHGYNSYNKGYGYNNGHNSYNKGYGAKKTEGSYSYETVDKYGNKVEASGSYEVEHKGHGHNNGYGYNRRNGYNSYNKGYGYNSYNKGYGYNSHNGGYRTGYRHASPVSHLANRLVRGTTGNIARVGYGLGGVHGLIGGNRGYH